MYGAQEKTRTSKLLRALVPETSASTNSATWASQGGERYSRFGGVVNTCLWRYGHVFALNLLCFGGKQFLIVK